MPEIGHGFRNDEVADALAAVESSAVIGTQLLQPARESAGWELPLRRATYEFRLVLGVEHAIRLGIDRILHGHDKGLQRREVAQFTSPVDFLVQRTRQRNGLCSRELRIAFYRAYRPCLAAIDHFVGNEQVGTLYDRMAACTHRDLEVRRTFRYLELQGVLSINHRKRMAYFRYHLFGEADTQTVVSP